MTPALNGWRARPVTYGPPTHMVDRSTGRIVLVEDFGSNGIGRDSGKTIAELLKENDVVPMEVFLKENPRARKVVFFDSVTRAFRRTELFIGGKSCQSGRTLAECCAAEGISTQESFRSKPDSQSRLTEESQPPSVSSMAGRKPESFHNKPRTLR